MIYIYIYIIYNIYIYIHIICSYIYIYNIGFCDICVYCDISNICYSIYLIYVGVWKKNREFSWWSLLLLYSRRGHVTNESATLKATEGRSSRNRITRFNCGHCPSSSSFCL